MSFRSAVVLATALLASQAQATLSMGDLAFTSFNADEDGWSVVALADIAANTTVYFSDNEWNGSSFNTGEGQITWSTGGLTLAAGSVVRFADVDKVSRSVSFGALSASGDNGINATSETIYAFLGSSALAPTVFLAGVSTEGSTHLAPAGLSAGVNAVVLTNSADYGVYMGVRQGQASIGAYRALVNDASLWTVAVGGDQAAQVPDVTAFSAISAPVPEPESWALACAGLSVAGLLGRRRLSR